MVDRLKRWWTGIVVIVTLWWADVTGRVAKPVTGAVDAAVDVVPDAAPAPAHDGRPEHPDKDPWIARFEKAAKYSQIGCYAFLVLFCLYFVGKVKLDVDWQIAWGKPWYFHYDFGAGLNLLPLFAILVVSFGILIFAKGVVTFYADTPRQDWFSRRLLELLGIGALCVVVTGSMLVQQEAKQEDFRGGLVAEEMVVNKAAGDQAVINELRARLAAMKTGDSYEAKAAREGGASWAAKVGMAKAQNDPRYERIARAQTTADASDTLNGQILQAIKDAAVGTTKAEVKADVGAVMTDPVSTFFKAISPWRMVILCLVMDLILVFGPYLAERRRRRLLAAWLAWTPSSAQAMPTMKFGDLFQPDEFPIRPAATPDPIIPPIVDMPNPEPVAEPPKSKDDPIKVPAHDRKRVRPRMLPPASPDKCAAAGIIGDDAYPGDPLNAAPQPAPDREDDDDDEPTPRADPDEGDPARRETPEGIRPEGIPNGPAGPDLPDHPDLGGQPVPPLDVPDSPPATPDDLPDDFDIPQPRPMAVGE